MQELSTWYGRQKQIMDNLYCALEGNVESAEARQQIKECARLAYLTLNELAIYKVVPLTPKEINKRNREFFGNQENMEKHLAEYLATTKKG